MLQRFDFLSPLFLLNCYKSVPEIEVLLLFCLLERNMQVCNNYIIRYLEDPSFPLSLLMDVGKLAAYRLPKENEKSPHVVFTHRYFDE